MKELSIEEKAKAYDSIIEKANKMHCENCEACQACIEELIPELEESDDERIRKALVKYFTSSITNPDYEICGVPFKEVLAWLEKQSEPTDKVEPKFHEGDWVRAISSGNIFKILSVNDVLYRVLCYDGVEANYPIEVEKDLAYWTIQDAKDGDVLATSAGAFIYNGNNGGGSCPGSYCGINTLGGFKTGVEHHWTGKKVYPATKEQRDQLKKAMADAGYTFDFEKKELNKIEQKFVEWDEEDENRFNNLIFLVECSDENEPTKKGFIDFINRLKSNFTRRCSRH